MDNLLREKEKELEEKKLDNEIQNERTEIAQKKAAEAEMKHRYGRDWKKFLKIGVKGDVMQNLYSIDPTLKDLAIPRRRR
jgi:hypothetical protein